MPLNTRPPTSTALLNQLRTLVGAAHVLTHQDPGADLSTWARDWRIPTYVNVKLLLPPGRAGGLPGAAA